MCMVGIVDVCGLIGSVEQMGIFCCIVEGCINFYLIYDGIVIGGFCIIVI